jgi:Cu(I)/Ag(I) efflux system protein CusF
MKTPLAAAGRLHQNQTPTAKASPKRISVGAQRGKGNAKKNEKGEGITTWLFGSAFLCESFALFAPLRWILKFDAIALLAAAILAAALCPPVLAAGEHDGHGAAAPAMKMQSQAPAEMKLVEGLVKRVDKSAAKVTLAHGPLTNLGMDMAMTMAFRVKDAAWLDQMKVGDRIRFVADNVNGALTVVKFEPAN